MKITLNRDQLRSLVQGMSKVVPRNGNAMPVLSHVRFEVTAAGQVLATTTDLEQALQLSLPDTASGSDPAAFLCPLASLQKLARELSRDGSVTLNPSPKTDAQFPVLAISACFSGQSIPTEVAGMPTDGFPAEPFKTIPVSDAHIGAFLDAYRKAIVFASRDATRSALNRPSRSFGKHRTPKVVPHLPEND
jgi:DNA polymerase III sliding clamp (beta) subunit (PCNA family)